MKKIILLLLTVSILNSPVISQNIGIGTATPNRAKLEVHGAVDATTAIFGGESSGVSMQRNWPGIAFNSYFNGGDRSLATGYGAKIHLDPNGGNLYIDMFPLVFSNALTGPGNRAITVGPTGYIGFGAITPNAPVQLANIMQNRKIVLWETANNEHEFYGLGIESGTMRYSVGSTSNVHRFYCGTSSGSSKLLFSIWGDRTVIIGDDGGGGKLGINLSGPAFTLSVKQAGGTGIMLQEAVFNTTWHFRAASFSGGTSNHMRLEHQGGIVGNFYMDGSYTAVSDGRLKKNIQNMTGILDKVMQLRPVMYELNFNNPDNKSSMGFIAQEVKPLFPELVIIDENPEGKINGLENLHTLNYSGFGIVAIKAIQEQQQLITDLQKRMNALEEQNQLLLRLINKKD